MSQAALGGSGPGGASALIGPGVLTTVVEEITSSMCVRHMLAIGGRLDAVG